MNREQVLQVLSILKAAYPHSFQNLGKRDVDALVTLWERQFADEDPQMVSAAVDSLIATRTVGYSPNPGEVKAELHRLRNQDELSVDDAWAELTKACRNGLYGYREEFEKLSPMTQQVVCVPEEIRNLAMVDEDVFQTVIFSNFRKSYMAAQERAKHESMLPANVREMVSGVADQMSIEQPKPPTLMPAKLDPMIRAVKPVQLEPQAREPVYQPPDPEEWERRRASALELVNQKEPN